MPNKDRALIFDMDGVLIDSEPLWQRAEIEIFGRVGLDLDHSDCRKTTGLRIDEAVAFWFERSPWKGPICEEIAETIVARMVDVIQNEGECMPGVRSSIKWAGDSGWRLALASSSSKQLIDAVLHRFDLADRFECLCSAEDEEYGKPHPAVYLSSARRLGIDPSDCVAIEDSANGVDSAIAAGMRCIAIPPPETRNHPRFAVATLQLDSLEELPAALAAV